MIYSFRMNPEKFSSYNMLFSRDCKIYLQEAHARFDNASSETHHGAFRSRNFDVAHGMQYI